MPEEWDDSAKWHWAEGMKFALEGVKSLFILNGAAAISILTFVGNMKARSPALIWAMLSFAFGAATTVPAMICAYLAQLHYGNATTGQGISTWKRAVYIHYGAYLAVGAGIVLFMIGAVSAAIGLEHNLLPK